MIVGDILILGTESGRAILTEQYALFDVVYYENVHLDLVAMLRENGQQQGRGAWLSSSVS